MIQFNLLPDVKVQYIKTQRTKRMVMLTSVVIAGVSVLIVAMTFSYSLTQKRHLTKLDKHIKSIRTELESNKELTKILSVQNQLNSLPQLYAGRPAADRLPVYIEQTTPSNVSISKLTIDFSTSTIEVSGSATSLSSVNTYVDTLKYTKFKQNTENASDEKTESINAFKDVVMTKFGTEKGQSSYTINLNFDPLIFDGTKSISLEVPSLITTYSQQSNTSPFTGTQQQDKSSGGNQ